MRLSYGANRARSGDTDLTFGPQNNPGDLRGVVLCHAYTHRASTFVAPNNGRPQAWALINAIGEHLPGIVSDQAGDSWANDTGLTSIDGCVTFLQSSSNPNKAASGKVLLVGVSMGFQVACAWARTHLSQVAAIAGILPAVDIDEAYDRDAATKTAVDTAYGTAEAWAAVAATRDPFQFASTLDVPIKLWYGAADTQALPERIQAFAAAAPQAEAVNAGNIGHDTEASYPLTLSTGLMQFLLAHS